jgi:hypothetical protein
MTNTSRKASYFPRTKPSTKKIENQKLLLFAKPSFFNCAKTDPNVPFALIPFAGLRGKKSFKFVGFSVKGLGLRQRLALYRDVRPRHRHIKIELKPFFKSAFGVRLDRFGGALRFAHAAIDAFIRMNDEHVLAFIEAIHRAYFDAVHVFAFNAIFDNDIGHDLAPPRPKPKRGMGGSPRKAHRRKPLIFTAFSPTNGNYPGGLDPLAPLRYLSKVFGGRHSASKAFRFQNLRFPRPSASTAVASEDATSRLRLLLILRRFSAQVIKQEFGFGKGAAPGSMAEDLEHSNLLI